MLISGNLWKVILPTTIICIGIGYISKFANHNRFNRKNNSNISHSSSNSSIDSSVTKEVKTEELISFLGNWWEKENKKKHKFIFSISNEKDAKKDYESKNQEIFYIKGIKNYNYKGFLLKENNEGNNNKQCKFIFFKESSTDNENKPEQNQIKLAKQKETLKYLKQKYQENQCNNSSLGLKIEEISESYT